MPLGSKSIKSLSREYTYREDEMTDEYECGDVARMPTSLLRRVLRCGVNFVSLNFTDYVSMALCMGDNRVGDTSDLLDLPQEMGLGRRGSF